MEFIEIRFENRTARRRKLDVTSCMELCLGFAPDEHREYHKLFIDTGFDKDCNCVYAEKLIWFDSNKGWDHIFFHACSEKVDSFDTDKQTIIGQYRSYSDPIMMERKTLGGRKGRFTDAAAALRAPFELEAGEEKTIVFTVGAVMKDEQDHLAYAKLFSLSNAKTEFAALGKFWSRYIDSEEVQTPDEALNFMTNIWLKYQAISCRLWGKSALYQVSAGYGFRDQLQDCQIFLESDPDMTRKQILLHASKQFAKGDVYHWWFTISGYGPQSNCSDDLLWLPFILDAYLKETNDHAILDEIIPFVDEGKADLYEHCKRAIELSFSRFSPRGVPLMGDHDWNDGLSNVGTGMKGESFWVGEFLYLILKEFIPLSVMRNDFKFASKCTDVMETLRFAVNKYGWDGRWFLQATTDGWEKLGSSENDEGSIFLNPNIWAAISGISDAGKTATALDSVGKYLLKDFGTVLLYPAYTKPRTDIGYITRYTPGLRENGGVYTHAATWSVWAFAIAGNSEKAYQAYRGICPPNRSDDQDAYAAEPYVTPGNSDGPISPYFGKGSWSWYTGSAQWLHRVAVYWILGIRPQSHGLLVDPCIPAHWPGYTVRRIFRGTEYKITVSNPGNRTRGVTSLKVDGTAVQGQVIPDLADGGIHDVEVVI